MKDDNKQTILNKGDKNQLAKQFKKFIGLKKKVLEVGCGTGQLANYFSIGTNNQIVGLDPTIYSLKFDSSKVFMTLSSKSCIEIPGFDTCLPTAYAL